MESCLFNFWLKIYALTCTSTLHYSESPQNKKQRHPWFACNCCIPLQAVMTKALISFCHDSTGSENSRNVSYYRPDSHTENLKTKRKAIADFLLILLCFYTTQNSWKLLNDTGVIGWGNCKKGKLILSVPSRCY